MHHARGTVACFMVFEMFQKACMVVLIIINKVRLKYGILRYVL